MHFSSFALSAAVAISAPFFVSGFTPTASFTRAIVKSTTQTSGLVNISHKTGCDCSSCAHPVNFISALLMSTETDAEAPASSDDDVPPEVAAMDGIASNEEAHNAERPARDSLKKKTKQESKGTPIGELEIGSMVTGKVKAIMAYGAFVDIGASTDALLHVSRLSDEFVSNVGDIVKEGETVEVRIVSVDEEKSQVGISMRSEEADNRQGGGNRRGGGRRKSEDNKAVAALAESGYDENKFVEGEVVSTLAFGAFVRVDTKQLVDSLEGSIEGLVHISSLAKERVESVDSVVSTGEKVQVRVKMIDAQGGKVSLSMISAADEQPAPQQRGRGQRPKKQRWAPSEMGAEDWQESLDKFKETQPAFKNNFVIVDKRNKAPVS